MPLVIKDRVRQATTTTGTGTITLSGTATGFQTFAEIGDGNTTYYTIVDDTTGAWEVGVGTYTASGTTLSRDTVLASSNGNALVNFGAGTKDVWGDYPAGKAVTTDTLAYPPAIGGTTPNAGTFTALTATGTTNLGGASGSSMVLVNPKSTNLGQFEVGPGSYSQEGYFGYTNNSSFAALRFNVRPSTGGAAFAFATYGTAASTGSQQFLVNHTSNAVNFVQVTGAATTGNPEISAQGSDAAVSLNLASKSTNPINLRVNGATQFQVVNGGSSIANRFTVEGAATTLTPRLMSTGSDTNVAFTAQSKGTGAINLAPGSSGVNISNGGTVTALTRSAPGGSYTSFPTLTISPPTTAGGVQATATFNLFAGTASVSGGGSGYTVNDVITLVGGTSAAGFSAATYTVTAVSGGVITAVNPLNFAAYSALPTSPTSVTGGTGTGATLSVTYGLSTGFTITNAGSGYVEQPTVTFSGGGGSGAAAYATVGGGTTIRSLGATGAQSIDFQGASSISTGVPNFRVRDTGANSFVMAGGATDTATLFAQGATNAVLTLASNGTQSVRIGTNGSSTVEQLRVAHTASAVNFVQVTGAATGNATGPAFSAQGSDANVPLTFSSKGTSALRFATGAGLAVTFVDSGGTTANFLQIQGRQAGNGPIISGQGSDANVDINLTTKAAGALRVSTGNGLQFRVNDTFGSVASANWWEASGRGTTAAPLFGVAGETNTSSIFYVKGSGSQRFATGATSDNGAGSVDQFRVAHVASAVNFLQVTGNTTGNTPIISVQGSDTNIGIAYIPKGTGSHFLYGPSLPAFQVNSQAANANYGVFTSTAAGTSPLLQVSGTDTNVDFRFRTQGTGAYQFDIGSNGNTQLRLVNTSSSVNYFEVTGGITGNYPLLTAQGSDTNVGMIFRMKGAPTGPGFRVENNNGANVCFAVTVSNGSVVNHPRAEPSSTGFATGFTAQGSDTNIPFFIQPRGTGALQAQQTDSTATGGNARGANAVDWQTSRTAAGQVSSGSFAVLSGGYRNTTNGFNAALVGGDSNLSSGNYAFVGGGSGNAVTQSHSAIVGGYTNTANGYLNFIGGGFTNSGTSGSPVTTQSATMNGTTTVTLSGSNTSIRVGQLITGTNIQVFPFTYVAAISGTTLTLSQAASGSGTATLSFFTPHGVVVGGGNNQATGAYSFIGGGGDAGTAGNRNVASGDWSFVGGGYRNTASGINSIVVGGAANTASGLSSFVGGGGNFGSGLAPNTASGTAASVVGGFGNFANGYTAFIGGGDGSLANADYASIAGGRLGTARAIRGMAVFPACHQPIVPVVGTTQAALLVLGVETTNATATVLRSDSSAAGTTNQVILPNNSAYAFKGTVIANVTGAANGAAWSFEGAIMRGANAASTVLIGAPVVNRIAASAGATAWTIAVTADTTNGGLAVTVTGAASTTIRWVAKLETTEVTF